MNVGTCGTYDYILHPGHIAMLEFCASYGSLVVFVVADETVHRNKGRWPYYDQETRAKNLADVPFVTRVVRLTESPRESINIILESDPDIYVFGPDQRTEFDTELERLLDCEIIRGPDRLITHSTTELLRSLQHE